MIPQSIYDDNDNLIEVNINNSFMVLNYKYNEENQLRFVEDYYMGELFDSFEYDLNGNLKIVKDYTDGDLDRLCEYMYESVEYNKCIKEMEWFVDNEIAYKYDYKYYIDNVKQVNEAEKDENELQ